MNWLKRLTGKKLLVTGARGFLGSQLLTRLNSVVDTELHASSRRRVQWDLQRGVTWHLAELTDQDVTRQLFSKVKPDVVFHLAGAANGRHELDLVWTTLQNDLATAVNVLVSATESGCERVILTGSLDEPLTANEAPASPYAAAKLSSNLYARMCHQAFRTPVVVVRPFMTYGPGQRANKFVPYVTRCFLQDECPRVSNGSRGVDWVYVADLVEGIIAAAAAPGIEGQIIDLGSGQLLTVRQVLGMIRSLCGSRLDAKIGDLPERCGESVRAADTQKARDLLGWSACTSIECGLKMTIDWHRQQLKVVPASPQIT
jgi:nucleoside-diphosphate-sugar epimerase